MKNLDDERQAIFEQWQRRDRELASQKEVGTAAQSNHSLTSSCAPPEVPVPSPEDLSKSASQQGSQEVAQQHNKRSSSTNCCDQSSVTSPPPKLLTDYLIGEVVWSWHYNAKRWFKAEVVKAANNMKDFLRVVGIEEDSKLANHLLTRGKWIKPRANSG